MNKLLLTMYCIIAFDNYGIGQARFNIPESVCVGQSVTIENTSIGGSTFYWNFCSGSLSNLPLGENLGNIGNLNMPVYSSIIKDGVNYFAFITNHIAGTISRLDFGNSLSNNPIGTDLGNFGFLNRVEGIQIKKDKINGNWYGLVSGFSSNYLARLNFGNSLQNTPSAENLGNVGNLMEGAHTLYTFEENNNWYTLVGNYLTNRLTLLKFGISLGNLPTAEDLGNVGQLDGPVGFYPVQDNGNWYLYVANQKGNSISRLDFGNSLTKKPTGVNLGNVGSALNAPRSIVIIRDCGTVFGFVVNENNNDVVRITFPNGLTSQPSGESLGNIAKFDFPHHISQLFRDGDFVYALVTNVRNNTLSRLIFKGCSNPSLPSSALKDPPSIKYDTPGTFTVSLVVDDGLPTQTIFCKQILVGVPVISIDPVSSDICEGSSTTLTVSGATSYLWSPAIGLSTTSGTVVKASPTATTTYTIKGEVGQGCSATKTVVVMVNKKPNVSIIPSSGSICYGSSINLTVTGNANSYLWSPIVGLSSATTVKVEAKPSTTTNYTVTGTDLFGCSEKASINLLVNPKPTISNITTKCQPDMKTYLIGLKNSGDQIFTKYGDITQQNSLYTITNIPKNISNTIVSTITLTGCKDTIIVQSPSCVSASIFIPEGFSPNKDGVNDYFEISGIEDHPNVELTIFAGSGQKVYSSENYRNDWDGSYYTTNKIKNEQMPAGVYYYVLKLDPTARIIKGFVYIAY